MTEVKNRGGRPPVPAAERRELYPLRLRLKHHEQLHSQGGADWIEQLLAMEVPGEIWAKLARLGPEWLVRTVEKAREPGSQVSVRASAAGDGRAGR